MCGPSAQLVRLVPGRVRPPADCEASRSVVVTQIAHKRSPARRFESPGGSEIAPAECLAGCNNGEDPPPDASSHSEARRLDPVGVPATHLLQQQKNPICCNNKRTSARLFESLGGYTFTQWVFWLRQKFNVSFHSVSLTTASTTDEPE